MKDRRNIRDFIHPNFAKRDNIGGNATKNVYVLRFLPLLVGNKIPEDDQVWHCIIGLEVLTEHVFAEKFSEQDIEFRITLF